MPRIIFVNNQFLPEQQATVPVMDRGFLFADSVYEVSAVINGRLVDNEAHVDRLFRSLGEIKIKPDFSKADVIKYQKELLKRNNLNEGLVYIQVTRGTAERDFGYDGNMKPNFVMFTQSKNVLSNPYHKTGAKAITIPDIRWSRRDIKSTALLAQVMAKNTAKEQGVFEAIMHQNGYITEGSSSNVFIVKDDKLITKSISNEILSGITRRAILQIADNKKLQVEERNIQLNELFSADECFITSASNLLIGIIEVDGKKIGNNEVGAVTNMLLKTYLEMI
ncbi:MAG TPA: D-amino acid aminotransferase [Alphaproteobacteria bacterium]|nr:D-amino acid aminotransferase [Alphaproteobacteria bacterium]